MRRKRALHFTKSQLFEDYLPLLESTDHPPPWSYAIVRCSWRSLLNFSQWRAGPDWTHASKTRCLCLIYTMPRASKLFADEEPELRVTFHLVFLERLLFGCVLFGWCVCLFVF